MIRRRTAILSILTISVFFLSSCQNPFTRPAPASDGSVSFDLVLYDQNSRSLSSHYDFVGKTVEVGLYRSASSGLGAELGKVSAVISGISSTENPTITVPVSFTQVPTGTDLVIEAKLFDADPNKTVYYSARSAEFRAGGNSPIDLNLARTTFADSAKTITSFRILSALNSFLDSDIVASISGTTINLTLPEGKDPGNLSSIVPSFAHTGAAATLDEAPIVSSSTAVNFSYPRQITIADKNNETASYTVSVNISGLTQTFAVSFDANGGTGVAMVPQEFAFDQTLPLNENHYTRVGHVFAGWNTSPDGSGTAYADGADFTMDVPGITLYAQWDPVEITITFEANGGVSNMSPQTFYYVDGGTAIETAALVRDGYSFVNWNTSSDGSGTTYANGALYTATVDVTLYAQWELPLGVFVTIQNPQDPEIEWGTYTEGGIELSLEPVPYLVRGEHEEHPSLMDIEFSEGSGATMIDVALNGVSATGDPGSPFLTFLVGEGSVPARATITAAIISEAQLLLPVGPHNVTVYYILDASPENVLSYSFVFEVISEGSYDEYPPIQQGGN